MNFLENCGFTTEQIKELEENIPKALKKSLIANNNLVTANLSYLKDLGVTNTYDIFKTYYDMFLMDNSNFKDIFNKYETADLIEKLKKNIKVVEVL